jgi:hypothetical protein
MTRSRRWWGTVLMFAIAIGIPLAVGIVALLHRTDPSTVTRGELERDGDFYRDSAGRQCDLDPVSLAHQEVRDGEITWVSLQDGRTVGFRFTGRTGKVFCGRG